jgi:pimeloyl-ACP methyl ester carboxylesterase
LDIILVAGLWLPSSIWSQVSDELANLGHNAIPVDLPGVDDGSKTSTLDDQVEAVLVAVDSADRPLVVGHSAACTLAWIAADRRPEAIAGVALIGGIPRRTARRTPTSSRSPTASWPSPAGSRSRGQTPTTSTRPLAPASPSVP